MSKTARNFLRNIAFEKVLIKIDFSLKCSDAKLGYDWLRILVWCHLMVVYLPCFVLGVTAKCRKIYRRDFLHMAVIHPVHM